MGNFHFYIYKKSHRAVQKDTPTYGKQISIIRINSKDCNFEIMWPTCIYDQMIPDVVIAFTLEHRITHPIDDTDSDLNYSDIFIVNISFFLLNK